MTATFADYAAQADARQSIADAVLRHTQALCEALRQNYIDYSIQRHQRALDTLTVKNVLTISLVLPNSKQVNAITLLSLNLAPSITKSLR